MAATPFRSVCDHTRLRDGTCGWIRPLPLDGAAELAEEFEQLSPRTRYNRFLTPTEYLSPSMLRHLVDNVDGVSHIAFVLYAEVDGEEVGAGVGRLVRYPGRDDLADVAVTVRDDWQSRGVASCLLQALVRHRPAGVTKLVTEVTNDNIPSLAMLRRLGETTITRSGPGRVTVVVHLDGVATPPEPDRENRADDTE